MAEASPQAQGADIAELIGDLRRARLRRLRVIAVLAITLVLAMLADLATGSAGIAPPDILRALLMQDAVSNPVAAIVWQLRLPFALMAVLVGMALSLAGAEMQTILDNPLASPFTLGVSSAASLGAGLAMLLGTGIPGLPMDWLLPINTFVFAAGSVLLLQLVGNARQGSPQTLVLFGIALVFTFNALVALLQYLASADALQQFVFWSMGSLNRSSWPKLATLAAVIALVLPFSLRATWRLTLLRFGHERARTLGIDVNRLRLAALLRISLLAATAVAFVGTIGFVGLVGPHIARLLVGEDHRYFLPASLLTGGLLMSLAAIAAKLVVPGTVLPIGIVTALVGVPAFLWLILRRPQA